jgi:hypothetical protein
MKVCMFHLMPYRDLPADFLWLARDTRGKQLKDFVGEKIA